ncbi:MAG: hypothetical protein COA42_00875 [Alteromonadaceae bacterium]|nr:MAG: hypothetical protein COA42_00875 [Alteromonadaceae bacterium]
MKAIKLSIGLIIFIALVLAGVGLFILGNLNQIIKDSIETYGPEVTKTSVLLNQVDVDIIEGKGQFNKFTIANPAGFKDPYLLSAEKMLLQIDPVSVTEDVIVINELIIEGVTISAEQKGLTTNIQQMLKQLPSSGDDSDDTATRDTSESEPRFMIEHLRFANNQLKLTTENFGGLSISMPNIDLNNLGNKIKGLTPTELGTAIVKPLLDSARKAVEKHLKKLAKDALAKKLNLDPDQVKQQINEKVDALNSEAKDKKDEAKQELENKKQELKDKVNKKLGNKLNKLLGG